jgi:hypothetical protein
MKKTQSAILRILLTVAVTGLGLVLTPRTASADLVFEVDETVVDDTAAICLVVDCVFDADKINGFYDEVLTINADSSFDVSALASFDAYVLGGSGTGTGLVGTNEAVNVGGYDLFATFSGSGDVDSVTGEITFDSASVTLYIDADQTNTYTAPGTGAGAWTIGDLSGDDEEVLSTSTLVAGTGLLAPGTGGFFDLIFGDILFTAFGADYYPTLSSLNFVFATIDGDFDTVPNPPVPGTYDVEGDLSVVFNQVPEPASLALFGVALLGSGMAAARRRRQIRTN